MSRSEDYCEAAQDECGVVTELRQQLAAAQSRIEELEGIQFVNRNAIRLQKEKVAQAVAACKLKDAALENAEGMLDELRDYPVTHDEIIEALAIQPDDAALKAWLGGPVCWMHYNTQGELRISTKKPSWDETVWPPLYSPKGLK